MPCLFVLLLYIIGLLLTDIELICLNIVLIIFASFLIVFKIKKRKKPLIIGIFLLILGICQANIRIPINKIENDLAFVVKRSENYCVLKIKTNKYLTYDLDEARLFDVIRVSGKIHKLDFKVLESGFNFEKYLNHNGIFNQLTVKKYDILIHNPVDTIGYQNKIINKFQSNEGKEMIKALLFGRQEDQVKAVTNRLYITSLLSTSGFFISFILYGFSKFFSYFMYEKHAKMFTFLLFLPFLFFNINRFSVVRVALLFLIHIISDSLNVQIDLLKKKSLIYLGLLLCNHSLIYSQSYYIPLLLTLILHFAYLFLKNEDSKITNRRRKVLIISILFPFLLTNNNSFNLLSILFTFTCSFYFKGLFLLAFLSFYGIYFSFYDSIFKFTLNALSLINMKYLVINSKPFSSLGFVIYFLILFIFLYFKEVNYKSAYTKILYVSIASFCIYLLPIKNTFTCEVSFINIGQGDSTLIRYRNKSYLIDTGGNLYKDLATESLIPYFRSKRIYKLDSVFITHYDFDHYGALESLKSNFIIDNIYDYNSTFPVKKDDLLFDNLNHFWSEAEENENNKSLVFKMKLGDKVFLFMGDSPSDIERKIINEYDVKCDILKLGHHGSKDSSCMEFLKEANPEVAIISCGKNNKYKHPNKETIERLNALKIPYRRTDIESTITYQFLIH